MLAFLALTLQPALAGVAFACGAPEHHGHDMAAVWPQVPGEGAASHHSWPADLDDAAPVSDRQGWHPTGCAGCGETGSHCCSSPFLVPAAIAVSDTPEAAREVFVDEDRHLASRPFDGPFRPPRTIPL
ncbi:MAG: hypothetical protein ACM3JC_02520 [Rudaea sp.]